jgi:tetratricopeptide (TPR) repeat protein
MPRHPLVLDQIKALEEGKALEPPVDTAASGAAEVLYSLGAAGNGEGDELASLIYLRLSLWLDPTNAMAIMMLGEVYERMGQLGSANEVYDLVPINSSFRYNSELQVALNLEQLGRSEDSVKQLNSLISHARGLDAYSALGNVYRSRKEFEAAGKAYSDAIALIGQADSSHWSLFYARGISYERTKQWPKAEADFRKALELWPDQPLVLNYLGYSWIDQGINLEEGFKMLKRAVELRPKDGYIVDSVGWAYYRLGKYAESLEYMEKAVSLKPSDPVINDHLGDVYWRLGRKLEAGFQWNHARDLKPEPEDLQKILDKIEKGLPDDTTSASGG